MNATSLRDNLDLREQAIARLHEPVDNARMVFQGLTLVGHRSSIAEGSMHWALPGGRIAWGTELLLEDDNARVVDAPSDAWLRDQQPVLRSLLA